MNPEDKHLEHQVRAMSKNSQETALDSGASSALNAQDLTDGIHEAAHRNEHAAGASTTTEGSRASAFSSQGEVGKEFTETGAVGSIGQKIGGAFDKEGSIGKQFTTEGSVGGTVENNLGKKG